MENKRYYSFSLYRLIASILILQFHIFFICYPNDITDTIYLSKFLLGLTALSGFIYSQKIITSVKSFCLDRLKRIIIPAFIALIIMTIWNVLFMIIKHQPDFISTYVGYRAFNNGLLIEPGNFYYIPFILVCYLLTPLLKMDKKWLSILITVLVIAIETLFIIKVEPTYIVTSYLIGYFVGKYFFYRYVNKYEAKDFIHLFIWAVTFISFFLISYYLLNGLIVIPNKFHYILRGFSLMIFGVSTLFIFLLASKFINKINNNPVLDFTDKVSYPFYLLNQTFMCGAMNVTNYVSNLWSKTILVYLFTISFAILVYYLSKVVITKINTIRANK